MQSLQCRKPVSKLCNQVEMTLFHVVSRYHSSTVYGEHNVIFHICSPLFAFRPAPCKNTASHVFSHISVAINSARCVQHLSHTGACHSLHLKHSCPDLKSPNGLLPTVWAMRNKWDVLPSPIVPLPLAPFFQFWVHLPGIICRCLQLYFFSIARPSRQSECWINYWMETKTAACGQVT